MTDNLETKFFKVFGIAPSIRKGNKYFSTHMRYVEQVAEEDLYPTVNGDTVLLLESCLGDFSVLRKIAPSEITAYAYKTNKIGKYAISRKDALLEYLIEYSEDYKDTVPAVFNNQMVG